jgi:hypothetical protein
MLSQKQPIEKVNKEVASMNANFSAGTSFSVASFFRSLFITIILVFAVSTLLGALFKKEPALRRE